jgi:hypothetical protein
MDPKLQAALFFISAVFAAFATFNVPTFTDAQGNPRVIWFPLAFLVFVTVFLGNAYKAI